MNKEEYLTKLREELTEIAISNVEGRIEYYSEMIDDRIEDGMTEEEAVDSMESIESIVETSKLEKPVPVLVKEKIQKSREEAEKKGHGVLWMILAIIGFPIWLPLLCVIGCILLTLYILLWTVVIVCYSVEFAFGVSALACLVAPFLLMFAGISLPSVIICLGGALLFGGLTVLLWKPIVALTKAAISMFAGLIKSFKNKVFS